MKLVNPYCTLADVQREARHHDGSDAGIFIEAINQTSRWIEWFCKRDFLHHNHGTSPLRVDDVWIGENVIYLPWPVISLAEIRIDGVAVAASEYHIKTAMFSATSRIERNSLWSPKPVSESETLLPKKTYRKSPVIELVGVFGFAPAATADSTEVPSPALPPDLRQACAVASAARSGKLRREVVGADGQRTSTTVYTIPKDAMAVLERYRIGVT